MTKLKRILKQKELKVKEKLHRNIAEKPAKKITIKKENHKTKTRWRTKFPAPQKDPFKKVTKSIIPKSFWKIRIFKKEEEKGSPLKRKIIMICTILSQNLLSHKS